MVTALLDTAGTFEEMADCHLQTGQRPASPSLLVGAHATRENHTTQLRWGCVNLFAGFLPQEKSALKSTNFEAVLCLVSLRTSPTLCFIHVLWWHSRVVHGGKCHRSCGCTNGLFHQAHEKLLNKKDRMILLKNETLGCVFRVIALLY